MFAREHAEAEPDKPAIIMAGSGAVVTYAEFESAANRIARFYRHCGLARCDHVAFLVENHPLLLECEGAAERTGLYFTCINHFLTASEVAYVVNDSKARLVVSSATKRDVAQALPDLCPNVEWWLMIGDGQEIASPYQQLEEIIGTFEPEPVTDERLGTAMLYSSGTTGRPKGILRPLADCPPDVQLPLFQGLKDVWRFREGMTYLSPAPLYHSAPQASISTALRIGATSVVMEQFDPVRYLDAVERYRITHSQLVPTMFSRMLKLPDDVRLRTDVSSLEVAVHAAAPCPIGVKEAMIEWWGPILLEYYAATEGNGITVCDSAEWLAHKGTVGRPVLGEVVILDEDGEHCHAGEPGIIWLKGATHFEYFNDPEGTRDSRTEDGDMSTIGDIGYLDDDGYLYLTDRKSFMIISGGVNIYPQETENLLITHPKVLDAAVIGIPNEDLGEEVKAVVQPIDGVIPSPELADELITFCRQHLSHHKCPRSVDFAEELPRLPTGKLYKRQLRDKYWEGHATPIL